MARPARHTQDTMLDAARGLVIGRGAAAATIGAIAADSAAPVGSVYHRFPSREALLAAMWLRAVRRAQDAFVTAARAEGIDPLERAVAAALSTFDFARAHTADATLLAVVRLRDLLGADAPGLEDVNAPLERALGSLARALGRPVGLVALATIDLPHGVVRRPLEGGRAPAPSLRVPLERAVRAALGDG